MSGKRGSLAASSTGFFASIPPSSENRFAEDMTREFSRRRDDAERRGFVALYWFALRTFAGITLAGALERSRSRGRSRRPRRRIGNENGASDTPSSRLAKAPAFTILAVLTLGTRNRRHHDALQSRERAPLRRAPGEESRAHGVPLGTERTSGREPLSPDPSRRWPISGRKSRASSPVAHGARGVFRSLVARSAAPSLLPFV